MCEAVRQSVSEQKANEIIFDEDDRPGKKIKFLCFNTIALPFIPENPYYKAGC